MFWKRKVEGQPASTPPATQAPLPVDLVKVEPHNHVPAITDERIIRTTPLFLRRLRENYYDFVDLGTCDGGGFAMAARQGGKRGLGFDLEPHAVIHALDKGLDVACCDVCSLHSDGALVDFAVCSHILEHLPSLQAVRTVLQAMACMCRDYILVFGPCFEEEEYLESKGLKILHSLMLDHTCKFKVIDFIETLHGLRLRDYVIGISREGRTASDNQWVHNATEMVPPDGLWTYDAAKHKSKPKVVFDREVYINFICVVPLRAGIDTDGILRNFLYGF